MDEITVIFARIIEQTGTLPLDWEGTAEEVASAIDPGVQITRYGKTWRFSRPEHVGNFLIGKLGFIRHSVGHMVFYDETRQDFVETDRPDARVTVTYSCWALDLDSLELAFELRKPDIDVQSFIGAFRSILWDARGRRFTLVRIMNGPTFKEWETQVQEIVTFRAVLRPPNPHWSERTDEIRKLVDDTNADQVMFEAKKNGRKPDGGIRVENTILEEVVGFEEDGYASFRAEGLDHGQKRVFDSKQAHRAERVSVDREEGSFDIWRTLMGLLRH